MQKEEKSNLEEQPVAESPYSHLYGKGSVVSQLQNYLEVGNSIRTTALELIKDAAAESALEARSPKWNDSLTQQVCKKEILDTDIKASIQWPSKNNKLRLKFF